MTTEVVTTLDKWAETIHADLTGAVEGLIAAGQHLREAHEQHPRDFKPWIESGAAGVSRAQAYRLMEVAESLGSVSTLGQLPPDRTALYDLAKLEPAQLEKAMEEVRPDMSRAQVREVVERFQPRKAPKPRHVAPDDTLGQFTAWFDHLRAAIKGDHLDELRALAVSGTVLLRRWMPIETNGSEPVAEPVAEVEPDEDLSLAAILVQVAQTADESGLIRIGVWCEACSDEVYASRHSNDAVADGVRAASWNANNHNLMQHGGVLTVEGGAE